MKSRKERVLNNYLLVLEELETEERVKPTSKNNELPTSKIVAVMTILATVIIGLVVYKKKRLSRRSD